jgi:hypothetical protein
MSQCSTAAEHGKSGKADGYQECHNAVAKAAGLAAELILVGGQTVKPEGKEV